MNKENDFFAKIITLPRWQFEGWHNVEGSTGAVMRIEPNKWLRIFKYDDSERGGIVERHTGRRGEPIYKCVISNKTPQELNEFIKQKYGR